MKKNNISAENFSASKIVLKNVFRAAEFFKKMSKTEIASLSISFVTDTEMEKINNTHLGHTGSTDVITFDYRENAETPEIDAEIIICADEAKRNAKEFGASFKDEIHRLFFHGLLHLTGYDDKTGASKRAMQSKEEEILNLWKQFNLSLSNNNGAKNA